MMQGKTRCSDISIFCGLVALIVFSHVCIVYKPAHASCVAPLLMQGASMAYSQTVNERVNELEFKARRTLNELGAAQAGYASRHSRMEYAWLQDLVMEGYLQPNQTGRSLAFSYSITFYLPPNHDGFTLVAEPADFDLRPYMITENQDVVLLTPSVMDDPNENWAEVRTKELDYFYTMGGYQYISSPLLISYDPILEIRLNRERTSYALHSLIDSYTRGFITNDSIVYIDSFSSYMLGDTRPEVEY